MNSQVIILIVNPSEPPSYSYSEPPSYFYFNCQTFRAPVLFLLYTVCMLTLQSPHSIFTVCVNLQSPRPCFIEFVNPPEPPSYSYSVPPLFFIVMYLSTFESPNTISTNTIIYLSIRLFPWVLTVSRYWCYPTHPSMQCSYSIHKYIFLHLQLLYSTFQHTDRTCFILFYLQGIIYETYSTYYIKVLS